jgi:hypothetical protein
MQEHRRNLAEERGFKITEEKESTDNELPELTKNDQESGHESQSGNREKKIILKTMEKIESGTRPIVIPEEKLQILEDQILHLKYLLEGITMNEIKKKKPIKKCWQCGKQGHMAKRCTMESHTRRHRNDAEEKVWKKKSNDVKYSD